MIDGRPEATPGARRRLPGYRSLCQQPVNGPIQGRNLRGGWHSQLLDRELDKQPVGELQPTRADPRRVAILELPAFGTW